ncbi:phage baseplate assembly protein V [Shinella sp. DD12]|uniref:phage baseplate assembly protein V n=1 Tax=Shinella sp. DD12 TaxID=1410620 RepID=UPI0003C53FF0|nr:phage baseplate assembly protein V [Shinella sp. DD12]EYR81875.1 phage P2 baseplate assembly protein GpV [Shinella sp. DD12]
MIPNTIEGQIADLYHRHAESERRARNRKRTGTVVEGPDDKGRYRVKISEQGGTPYLSPWVKPKTYAAGGVKMDVVYTVGEQVDLVSESGDLTDAVIEMSTYSEANARENTGNVPLHIKIGSTVIQAGGDGVTITAGKIVLDGEVHLGGEGGQLLHRKGDADSDGDTAVGSATRVYAV